MIDTSQGSFSGHETFAFRYGWPKKGIDAVLDDPAVFAKDTAMVSLGVGKNMVRSIRHWCLTARLIEPDPEVSNNRGRLLWRQSSRSAALQSRKARPLQRDGGLRGGRCREPRDRGAAADALLEPKHIAHLAIKGKVLLPADRARIE